MADKNPSPQAIAMAEVLRANPGKSYTIAELCEAAGVENKTGYMAGVKSILGKDNIDSEDREVEVTVTKTLKAYSFRG